MSKTKINIGAVMLADEHVQSARNTVSNVITAIPSAKAGINADVLNRYSINERLQAVERRISALDDRMLKTQRVVQNGANSYYQTETKLCAMANDMSQTQKRLTPGDAVPTNAASLFAKNSNSNADITNRAGATIDPAYLQRAKRWGKDKNSILPVEYAMLAKYCSDAGNNNRSETEIRTAFLEELKVFPQGHPLRNIYEGLRKNPPDTSFGIVEAYKMGSAKDTETVVIKLAGGNAIVIFAGTDVSNGPMDIVTDIGLTAAAAGMPLQQMITDAVSESAFEAANGLIRRLEHEGYHNISVTGHSLGGHLAADVTLHNSSVNECVTFDPPGRGDSFWQYAFNAEQVGKIKNYLANGSVVHVPGTQVGQSERINVEFNTDAVIPNHDIQHMIDSEALGGMTRLEQSWGVRNSV